MQAKLGMFVENGIRALALEARSLAPVHLDCVVLMCSDLKSREVRSTDGSEWINYEVS